MTSLPLHPAIVHLPLGLAFLMPALALGVAWTLWRGGIRSRAWLPVILLQAVLVSAGLVAMKTGERDEERVERIVPAAAIHRHEEYAEQFVWAAGLTLVPAVLVFVFRKPAVARAMTILTVAGTFVSAAAAIRAGHAGGQLVYMHNAGAAYASEVKTIEGAVPTSGDEKNGAAERTRGQ
jgi:hypothetical protein